MSKRFFPGSRPPGARGERRPAERGREPPRRQGQAGPGAWDEPRPAYDSQPQSSSGRYIYGRHPVAELMRGQPKSIRRLFVASGDKLTKVSDLLQVARQHGIAVVDVPKRKLDDLVGGGLHQGIVAQVDAFAYSELAELLAEAARRDEAPLLVALDQIQDPHNFGAIIRSAFAFGAHGVIVPKDRNADVTPVVVKSSAGATAYLKVAQVTNLRRCLDELKAAGLWVIGTGTAEGLPLEKVDFLQPTVLVIGSEGSGMRRLITESCDTVAHIPMPGELGSLNASVATGVVLYEAVRQRRAGSETP